MKPASSPVKNLALARGLDVVQPLTLNDAAAVERLAESRPEVLVVAAYGLILPVRVLEIAPLGAINIHASLLPRWRGAAPIQRALMAGDRETGITIMQMDAGLDTGPILSQHPIAIDDDDDAQSLHDKLAALGARAIVGALADLGAGKATPVPQPEAGATYARKIAKADAQLDWTWPCADLERLVRAMRPTPGAHSMLRGEGLKLWRVRCVPIKKGAPPGTVLRSGEDGVLVACGEGALLVTELQRAGGLRLPAADFLRGCPISAGERLGTAR